MRRFISLASAVLLAALAAAPSLNAQSAATLERDAKDQAKLDKALSGKTPGKPISCISLPLVRNTTYIGDATILYRVSSKLVYRNDPVGGCLGLRGRSGLVTRTPSTRLCSGDIAQVQDFVTGFQGGSCSLSEFVPYTEG